MKPATTTTHPSFLELDRHALGAARSDVAAHVAVCERCRAHLRQIEPAADVPAWALEPATSRSPRFGWLAAIRRRPLGWSVAAFACAAAVWLAIGPLGARRTGGDAIGGYVGTKGGPALWLYVKRGERVDLWNGTDPVHPGDLLRLKVQPDRYPHISVFGVNRTPPLYSRLYDAAIVSGQPIALPFSWKVDAQPGDETLLVVLGPEAVSPDQVASVVARADERRYWSRRLVLAKALPREGAPP